MPFAVDDSISSAGAGTRTRIPRPRRHNTQHQHQSEEANAHPHTLSFAVTTRTLPAPMKSKHESHNTRTCTRGTHGSNLLSLAPSRWILLTTTFGLSHGRTTTELLQLGHDNVLRMQQGILKHELQHPSRHPLRFFPCTDSNKDTEMSVTP